MDANTEAADVRAAAQPPAFLFEAAFAARINLADPQSAVPLLTPRTWRLDALGAKQQYRVTDLGIALDGAALARCSRESRSRAHAEKNSVRLGPR